MTGEAWQRNAHNRAVRRAGMSDDPHRTEALVLLLVQVSRGSSLLSPTWAFDAYQDVSKASHTRLEIAIPQI
jgi:hypothetical protein